MARPKTRRYPAEVAVVLSGDSFIANVDQGFFSTQKVHIKLSGIKSPDKTTPDGQRSKDYLKSLLQDKKVEIQTFKTPNSVNGVWLATVYLGSLVVNPHMVQEGWAEEFSR